MVQNIHFERDFCSTKRNLDFSAGWPKMNQANLREEISIDITSYRWCFRNPVPNVFSPEPMGGDKLPTSTWLPGLSYDFPSINSFHLLSRITFCIICVAILFLPQKITQSVLTPLFFTPNIVSGTSTPSWAEWTKHNWPGEKQPGQSTVVEVRITTKCGSFWNKSFIMATTKSHFLGTDQNKINRCHNKIL